MPSPGSPRAQGSRRPDYMTTLDEKRHKRATNIARMRELHESASDGFTPEQRREFDTLDSEVMLLEREMKIELGESRSNDHDAGGSFWPDHDAEVRNVIANAITGGRPGGDAATDTGDVLGREHRMVDWL